VTGKSKTMTGRSFKIGYISILFQKFGLSWKRGDYPRK
jgi:hypothetical protein